MRADPFFCDCGFEVWIDLGKFFTTKEDGTWSGEITHCPHCGAHLKSQKKEGYGI